ncbi:MAG TPA: hypothetical protein VMB50_11865 [Myxococcales bacterium]|nr:hypothetical protein [Myxococcales bacterium]
MLPWLAALALAQTCRPGEYWDTSMDMCMPGSAPAPSAPPPANARLWDLMTSPDGCAADGYYELGMSMCEPRPARPGRFSGMVMGNAFLAGIDEEGPRGRLALSSPNWLMGDVGVDLARWNRLELDAMLTAELWTTPSNGYPELLQIGEDQSDGQPFLDAQHPHSSPIMGLTLTDVVALGAGGILRVFFAPRGESTDGPIAFMHRPTGTVNPDAPLGHHIGQDVGHITSTALGAGLYLGHTIVEASTFHGLEPQPTQVDLPLGAPDSAALRLSQILGPHLTLSASGAYVNDPEGDPTVPHDWRLSASAYGQADVLGSWRLHVFAAWGGMIGYDHATFLDSFIGEALLSDDRADQIWGRLEVLQRTPAELEVAGAPQPDVGQWVGALTLGYTRVVVSVWGFDFSAGVSGTASGVPDDYAVAYGHDVVFSGKVFLEARFLRGFSVGG